MKPRKHTTASRNARKIAEAGTAMAKRFRSDAKLAAASTRVVAHRASLIAEALHRPDLSTGVEVARMGAEKVSAVAQAGAAALIESSGVSRLWLGLWFRQAQRAVSLTSALTGCRSQAAAMGAIARATEAALADLFTTGVALTRVSQGVADAAIKPIHRAAVANARRLAG